MEHPKIEEYLNEVCSHVKHKKSHKKIKRELFSHLEDKIEDLSQTMSLDEATKLALKSMGSPEEIGKELNKQHKRILSWVVYVLNTLIFLNILVLLLFLALFIDDTPMNIYKHDATNELGYVIEVDEKITIDDRVVILKEIVVFEDSVNVYYMTYRKLKFGNVEYMVDFKFTEIYDDLGNKYGNDDSISSHRSFSKNVFRAKTVLTLENFDSLASSLTFKYDKYNRKFEYTVNLEDEVDE